MTKQNLFEQLRNELHYNDEEISRIERYGGLNRLLENLFDSEKILYLYYTFFTNDSVITAVIRDDYLVVTDKRIIVIEKGLLGTIVKEYSLRKAHSITIENNSRLCVRESANSTPIKLSLTNDRHIMQLKELLYDYI